MLKVSEAHSSNDADLAIEDLLSGTGVIASTSVEFMAAA